MSLLRTAMILAATALTLVAQGRPRPEPPRREAPRWEPGERPARPFRDRIVAQLHEVRTQRLQQSLGLTQARAGAIADRWARFDEESFSRRQQMGQLRQQMNATLTGPGSEEDKNRKLQPVVEQLTGLRQQQQESRKRFEEDIQDRLTPAQQGRFILLVDEFQKSLQEAIRERRRDRP